MKIAIKIKGLREIREAMQSLSRALERRLLNRALLKGARLVRDEARRLAPVLREADPRRRAGVLQKAVHAGAVRPERYAATVWVRVRPLTRKQIATFKKKAKQGVAANPNDPFYWRFVEFGTSKMAARPFLRPAFDRMKTDTVEAAVAEAREQVQLEISKLGQFASLRNQAARFFRG